MCANSTSPLGLTVWCGVSLSAPLPSLLCLLHRASIPPISVTYSNRSRGSGRQRGGKAQSRGSSHEFEARRVEHTHTHARVRTHILGAAQFGDLTASFSPACTSVTPGVAKMWTEVGKLLLFHLLLTELHCAKGKVALCLEGGGLKKTKNRGLLPCYNRLLSGGWCSIPRHRGFGARP